MRLNRLASAVLILAVLLCGVSFTSWACAGNAGVHVATTVDTTIVNALHQVYLDEQTAYKANLYPQTKHDGYLKIIRSADQDALALTDAIDSWRVAGANPKTVPVIVATAKAGLQQILDDLSGLPATNALVVALKSAIAFLS